MEKNNLRIAIICSGNFPGGIENLAKYKSFVFDQVKEVEKLGSNISFFLIKGKGVKGYMGNRKRLKLFLKEKKFDIIHAHSGLSGLLVSLSTLKPFIVTFHGSDVNKKKERLLSLIPGILSRKNIFVSEGILKKFPIKFYNKNYVLPCGVNTEIFKPIPKNEARKIMNIKLEDKIILFTSGFNNKVKNYPLARKAIHKVTIPVKVMEIVNYTREEVALLLNSADVLIMTSFTEGSPQIVKEANSCNLPVVSVDVGDVNEQLKNVSSSFIVDRDESSIAEKLELILKSNMRSKGRDHIKKYDNKVIINKLLDIYIENKN